MKENSNVTDTNVGDIEECIKRLEKSTEDMWFDLIYSQKDKDKDIQILLSDYKRVLKENEELKEDRNNNNEMVALARNEVLNYMTGYEDGKKHKMTATAQVVENQQYYIIQKQIEKYEEHIKRLQKENKKFKNQVQRQINAWNKDIKSNYISKHKIKATIEEYKNMLKTCNKAKDIDRIKAINERILELQELIEKREEKE